MSDVVRFAPSPTGFLHIGGVRTALYNWLWARQNKGTFILRIEDTDRDRSTQESVQVIFDSMKWLGLDWDQGPMVGGPHGPYFQTERLPIYQEFTNRLIASGAAFRCVCTKEELDVAREAQKKANPQGGFKYPGTCRDKKHGPDQKHVIRLKAPKGGKTGWNDLVRGRIDVPNDSQQDVVLVRTDGIPLYNFGAVVDDITMGVTLVGRGDDHIVNTPIQVLLYEALGAQVPKFAHLPMILGPDGQKLSKRHAAVSVTEYRDQGFLPDSILNYLARLGWSHGDQEIFTRSELIEKFNWDSCGKTGARYDAKKFAYVQKEHLLKLGTPDIRERTKPFLSSEINPNDSQLELAIRSVISRATTLVEVAQMVDFYFRDTLAYDEKAKTKFLTTNTAHILEGLSERVKQLTSFEIAAIEADVTQWLTDQSLSLKDVAQPARVALTGLSQSPGLFEVMNVLGKDKTLERLALGISMAKNNPAPAPTQSSAS